MKSSIIKITALVLACALTGCVTPYVQPTRPTATPFDAAAFVPYAQTGTAEITGQAFLKTMSGDVKLGAGCTINLFPATTYMKEVISMKEQGIAPTNHTPENVAILMKHARQTVADAEGRFKFSGLPAGEYSLETTIEWQYVNAGAFMSTTGGLVRKMITVADGDRLNIVLTR